MSQRSEAQTNMSGFDTGRARAWSINSNSSISSSQTDQEEGSWKNSSTPMSAISFGFVATAILISMFIIMAIYEHLFRPNASNEMPGGIESIQTQKLQNPDHMVQASYASDFTVVMPGQQYPTFIAHPAPMACQREGIYWPSHEYSFA
ncbi:uncharacterized protein LOC127261132 [Andrographis paniculata]|uniref:uncharacterized protein LOC127261132 n=1 Tax=Andrographis paniculata TaxID=175694 RepID=UPI0021E88991|nr:uncharacterized protein LOC127261132 [Andrographis paniculata]XP_051145296.1 uncharacterized protein LOC127261132 [Andrographis paniculata]XP_051145297.1 uncharacterized protein LOC127261132 [Andrographis paniculata]XP_051145298.1 uncharacterized protein LOC127261132 [Andrographis paniculata]